jgi:hypothetical protein
MTSKTVADLLSTNFVLVDDWYQAKEVRPAAQRQTWRQS